VSWNVALPLAAAGSGVAWAQIAARRTNVGAAFALRALLGGAAAFGLSAAAYDGFALAGLAVRWETVAGGGPASVLAALAIGAFEEGAKLAGILLVLDRRSRPGAVAAAAVGVAAGFSALEAVVVLGGEASAAALVRAALGPAAHALLAAPLALGIVAWGGRPGRRALALSIALAAAAALHGGSDLALAVPGVGPYGYAAALALPAFVLFARKRKGPLGWRTLSTHRGRPLLGSPAGGRSCV
jgi:RsiW-degrading membrane proteinase PrsW (M82 family)